MALKTGSDYKESMKKMDPVMYVNGEKVDNYCEHPLVRPVIETVAAGYDLAHHPAHRECAAAVSHLTGEPINRFIYVATSAEELIKREQQIRLASFSTGQCVYQCTGTDAINAAAATTFDVDRAMNTNYHDRFNEWLTYIHRNDLAVSGAITDVKGNRMKRPKDQANPDLFTRVVEKRPGGIVVRGAKVHQSGAIGVHEHLITPTQAMREGEEAYALVCAVPSDEKGVIHINQFNSGEAIRMTGGEMDFGNIKYGPYSTQVIIFDNVFVPWERVFLCGEIQESNNFIERFGRIHRCVSSACTSGWIDDFIGVAQSLADYNGVGNKNHIRDKITEMNFRAGRAFACGIAAASMGYETPSGVYLPNRLLSNIAKLDGALSINECRRLAIDIVGGLTQTAPGEKDFKSPEIGKYIQEFFQGAEGVPTEHRLRMFKLAHHLFTSSGVVEAKIQGSGPSETQRMNIYWLANLELKKRAARLLCGIEEDTNDLLTEYAMAMSSNQERRDD